ncbi:hypothetical protein JCM10207_007923 [Rhodosporidiobolus poonsookiae]
MATLKLAVQFSGGMELLFNNEPNQSVTLPAFYIPSATTSAAAAPAEKPAPVEEATDGAKKADVRFLIWWLREFLLEDRERPELFSQGESVRPGILVLINSTDWELEGELEYELEDGDEVVFISTLHGGVRSASAPPSAFCL